MHILIVCTANRCRSPIAAALLQYHAALEGTPETIVASAGLMPGGESVPVPGLARMAEWNIDLSGHVSRQVDAAAVDDADLVLGMARDHVRDLVAADDSLHWRSFTLKDFVRRAAYTPRAPDQTVNTWIRGLSLERSRRQLLRSSRRDDIIDPMGRPDRVWNEVVSEIDEWTLRLARILAR